VRLDAERARERQQPLETVGAALREMMPFLKPVTIPEEEQIGAGARKNG